MHDETDLVGRLKSEHFLVEFFSFRQSRESAPVKFAVSVGSADCRKAKRRGGTEVAGRSSFFTIIACLKTLNS